MVDEAPDTGPRYSVSVWALALTAPVMIAALVVALVLGMVGGDVAESAVHGSGAGLAAAPLDLGSVSPEVASHFIYAEAHPGAYSGIPCYCGCTESFGHRHLYDCFVRSDGKGWDAHAAGCGVCIGESVTARAQLEAGQDPGAVRDVVIQQFGSTPATIPPA